ncbi:MAG: hypothetical protein OFPII_42390 [Osedax symbiont Rs1]|nr:MAG: hypothetical protein OFPII_42390 [Osedax symbiont Rs1]
MIDGKTPVFVAEFIEWLSWCFILYRQQVFYRKELLICFISYI